MTDNNTICGFCKQKDYKVCYPTYDIYGNSYNICKCNSCKAYFLSPRPDEALLAKAYSSDYYGESEEKFEGLYERVIDYFRSKRAYRLSRFLNKNASVLDIGCGNGKFLKRLLKYDNYQLYGIELEGNSAKRAASIPEIKLKIGVLEDKDFELNSIDAVTMFQVFEHLTEPKETLNIIKQILKKDGILIMSFPNINSLQSKIFKGKWLHLDPPRHLFYFRPNDLVNLMKSLGFIHVKSSYACIEQNPFGMVQSILNILFKKRELLFEMLKGNKYYAKEHSSFILFLQKIFFFSTFPFFILTDYITALFRKGATVEMIFKKLEEERPKSDSC
jgi:SAM-dependent methyltransferase